jgi:zinc protease
MSVTVGGLNPVRRVMANGLTVVAKESRVTPAVTIHLSAHVGTAFDPSSLPGLAYFLSRLIDRGTASMDADAIAETLESRGVSLASSISRHALSLICTCLVEDVDPVLRVMADCLMHPVFPDSEIAIRRGEMITAIRQDEDNPAAVAMDALMESLYGADHPYGRRPRGTVAGAERIDRAALVDFHRRTIVPSAVVVAIVGDLEAVAATRICEEVFGDWQGGGRVAPACLPRTTSAPLPRTR